MRRRRPAAVGAASGGVAGKGVSGRESSGEEKMAAVRRTQRNAASRLRQTRQTTQQRQAIERQLRDERDKWKCKICLDGETSAVVLPCALLDLRRGNGAETTGG